MVMHHLGVHMGNELGGYEATGGGEAIGLANSVKSDAIPATDPKTADGQLSKQLKAWIVARKAKPFETAQVQVASIRISADSQTTSTKPSVTR